MHFAPVLHDIGVILLTAGIVALLFQKIRQPVVLGYLIAGIIVGPHTPPMSWITDIDGIQICSELGVIFLLFALGLEVNFKQMKSQAVSAGVSTLIETSLMLALGYGVGQLLGYDTTSSLFLAGVIAISSSAVVLKTFSELGLRKSAFADFAFGLLVFEDFVAILLTVALGTVASGEELSFGVLMPAALQLILSICVAVAVGWWVVPAIVNRVARFATDETLAIFSLGLCLGLVLVAIAQNYSAALGAFLMGALIARSNAASRIEHLMRPLRDVFGAIFFVSIGMMLDPKDLVKHAGAILIVALAVIIGKILSVFFAAKLTRQSTRVALAAGLGIAQIGEFSFIIAELGNESGRMDRSVYAIAVSVAVLTTFTNSMTARLVLAPRFRDAST